MRSNTEIEREIHKIRTQGRAQIIILVSSLVLVFLWFTTLSWVFDQPTFGQEAFEYMAGEDFSVSFLVIISFNIALLFTIAYIYILRKFTRFLTTDEEQ